MKKEMYKYIKVLYISFLQCKKFKYFFGGLFMLKNKAYIAKINDSQVLYKKLNKGIIQNRINIKIT